MFNNMEAVPTPKSNDINQKSNNTNIAYKPIIIKKTNPDKSVILNITTGEIVNKETPKLIIGYHVSIQDIKKSLSTHPFNIPLQMFVKNPIGCKDLLTNEEITTIGTTIKSKLLTIFIHSVYVINLSNPFTKNNTSSDQWVLNLVITDLQIGAKLGCKGVVIHVGKHLQKSESEGLTRMTESINKVLPYATQECPLLLETPAGQGTELLTTVEKFISYYLSFSEDNRKKFKLCIDTCHIFATGYDPIDYLKTIEKYNVASAVAVIHFNDSKFPKNSMKDRHEEIGKGYIGQEKLNEVVDWANQRNIPLIREHS